MLGEKFKYLENGKSFKGELKIIFHHFKGFKGTSVAKNCLRPYSVPLSLFRIERRGGGKAKRPNYQCCPISTNVVIIPQNFWTFIFNPFFSLMQNLKTLPSASSNLLNLNQEYLSKMWFFCSNLFTIEVMITSFREVLKLLNFVYIITSTIYLHDVI